MQANQDVKDLFTRAMSLTGAAREQVLSGHPDQDSSLRCRELLEALDRPDDFLEQEASSLLGAAAGIPHQDAPTNVHPSASAPPAANTDKAAPRPVPQVPGYDLLHSIGQGGVGEVWLARNRVSLQFCALKLVDRASEVELEGIRHYKERAHEHPHLFPIEHVGEVDGRLFCVMPLAENGGASSQVLDPTQYEALTLRMHAARKGRLSAAEVIEVGIALADALSYLHERGAVHCDLKPANVMRLGGTWRIGDHGLMANLKNKTASGWTEGFCPAEGAGTPAADQYALGRTLFIVWTGLEPENFTQWAADSGAEGSGVEGSLREPADTPLRNLILRCCALRPHERFASCAHVRQALRDLAPRANATQTFWSPRRLMVAGLAATLIGAGAVTTLMTRPVEQPRAASIKSLSVQHFTVDEANQAVPTGVIGLNPVAARMDDDVRISAELAAPAYCFLIALNPDGAVQLCYPESASQPPEKTATIVYPQASMLWSLTDGAGLQAFALIASAQPLPSFDEWSRSAGELGWKSIPADAAGVWEFDGQAVQPLLAHRGEARARTIAPEPFERAVTRLGAMPGITVRAVAFPVNPKP